MTDYVTTCNLAVPVGGRSIIVAKGEPLPEDHGLDLDEAAARGVIAEPGDTPAVAAPAPAGDGIPADVRTVPQTMAWVNEVDELDETRRRAAMALEREQGTGDDARSSLVDQLTEILED